MTNVTAAVEYAQTFEREAMREKLDAALGDLDHMNLIQLQEVVVRHEQEIQELKRLITPMMEFNPEKPTMGMEYAANFEKAEKLLEKKEWVGLTEDEIEELPREQAWWGVIRAVEALLKEKNT